jgi:hypothetical protein
VRELFFRAGSSEHLHTTHNKSKPAFFLNPQRLGQLVALIESDSLTDLQPRKELVDVRAPLISARSRALTGNRTGLQPWYRESRCSRKSLDSLMELVDDSVGECSPENRLARFFPHTPTHILLAFLWKSVATRKELLNYLLALDKSLGSIFRNGTLSTINKRTKWRKNTSFR